MKRFFVALVLVCLAVAPAAAQVLYGSLTGIVHDAAGAVIPNASVKVVNTGTAQEFTSHTDEVGSYTVSSLPPGLTA